jgi:hypothetical protein
MTNQEIADKIFDNLTQQIEAFASEARAILCPDTDWEEHFAEHVGRADDDLDAKWWILVGDLQDAITASVIDLIKNQGVTDDLYVWLPDSFWESIQVLESDFEFRLKSAIVKAITESIG